MTDDLDRLARLLTPEMIHDLVDMLATTPGPAGQSAATFYHGLGGKITSMHRTVSLPSTSLDGKPTNGVESSQRRP